MGTQRAYLPSFADLVDRLTIVQMKAIFIPERKDEYLVEMTAILHDIDLILFTDGGGGATISAREIRAICVLMLTNRFIWENESAIRAGAGDLAQQAARLRLTHSINGVRNTAKNELAAVDGGRHDFKIDCLAADLPPEFGDWRVFDGAGSDSAAAAGANGSRPVVAANGSRDAASNLDDVFVVGLTGL